MYAEQFYAIISTFFPTFCCSAILTAHYILNGLYYLFTLNLFSTHAGAEKSTAISSITELYLIHVCIGCRVTISCAYIQITKWHPKRAYSSEHPLSASRNHLKVDGPVHFSV